MLDWHRSLGSTTAASGSSAGSLPATVARTFPERLTVLSGSFLQLISSSSGPSVTPVGPR